MSRLGTLAVTGSLMLEVTTAGGSTGGAGSDGTGGGDDVLYITDTFTWCDANKDILAWESYYNHDGNPPDLQHTLTNYTNAQTAYKHSSRWGV